MKIVHENSQTSISMAQSKRTQNEGQEKKNGGSIFAGDLKQNEDSIIERKKRLLKDAMKVVLDQYEADGGIDRGMEESRALIESSKNRMEEANTAINELQQERELLRDKYGVAPDSQEQKDLELIEIAREAKSEGRLGDLSEEELTRLAEMGPLTDYQRESLNYADIQDVYRKELQDAKTVMQEESRGVESTKQSLLGRKYHMGKAAKISAEMQKQAAKEIAGMMYNEAKEHIDEEFKELQEAAQKEAEKKKEQEEIIEKTREDKEQIEEQTEAVQEAAKQQDTVLDEIKKLAEEQKLLEEDMHGLVVDQYL